ncbi:MAG: MMPL family transporter [Gaiellales bacterium]
MSADTNDRTAVDPTPPEPPPVAAGRIARAYAWVVVTLRWLIVPAWLVAAAYIALLAPNNTRSPANLISLVPAHAPALELAQREARMFQPPLTGDTMVVQRDPAGLSARAQAQSLALAATFDRRALHGANPRMIAIPVPNTLGLFPSSRENGTTIVTYLEHSPTLSAAEVVRLAHDYTRQLQQRSGSVAGVTGVLPAQWREGALIEQWLRWVELATVLAILLVVAILFRSLGAALMTLVTIGIANLAADQVLTWAQTTGGISVPEVLRPMQVALVLGIGTDYCVFYMSAFRLRSRRGESRVPAARAAAAEITPIVVVGGLILAAGLAALYASRIAFFRDLGPGLAITVLTTMVVAVTFVPAVMGIVGRLLLRRDRRKDPDKPESAKPGRMSRMIARRPVAAVVALLVIAVLGAAATGMRYMHVGFSDVTGLPSDAPQRSGYDALVRGFAPGMLAPTKIVVWGRGVGSQSAALDRLQHTLEQRPGVAAVIGPADRLPGVDAGLLVGRNGGAARYIVVLDRDPLGAPAIRGMRDLNPALPGLARGSGLRGAQIGVTGTTALAQETTSAMRADVLRLTIAVLTVTFVLLAIYLRAIVAPLMLLAASVLSVAATLGITAWIVVRLLGYGEVTYYVPYAAAVLLVALGSDYNVFVTGRMWQEARRRPLRTAVAEAGPRAAGAVRTAGITLSVSFAAIALIPVRGFREFAFAMALGVAIETFLVRPLLVPAMISLVGYPSGWPGRRLRAGARTAPASQDA